MGYRIDPGEPTDRELRRVAAEQLGRAAELLRIPGGPDPEAVHEVRKRLKKARSALRLGRADLGAAVARHANAELRDVGASLAEQRDADALVEAVDQLLASADPATAEALAVVRALLAERAQAVRAEGRLDRATVIGAARTVEQTVAWLDGVPARVTGWDAFGPGLAREYGRGRRALGQLPHQPSVDELHDWRKRVKDLWYHERLLRRLWTDGQRPVVAAADELASMLGADHDLGLLLAVVAEPGGHDTAHLRSTVERVDPLALDPYVRAVVDVVALGHRAQLQHDARRLGALLYADRPRAWRDRHGAWWAVAARAEPVVTPGGADPSPAGANA